jgi:hypothetical protein
MLIASFVAEVRPHVESCRELVAPVDPGRQDHLPEHHGCGYRLDREHDQPEARNDQSVNESADSDRETDGPEDDQHDEPEQEGDHADNT